MLRTPLLTVPREQVRAATSDDGASRPWRSSTALAEPAHLCIDACSNTYTVTAYTPRQESHSPVPVQRARISTG